MFVGSSGPSIDPATELHRHGLNQIMSLQFRTMEINAELLMTVLCTDLS